MPSSTPTFQDVQSRQEQQPQIAHEAQPVKPQWAVDYPIQAYAEHAPLLFLEKSVLINAPFVGAYHPISPDATQQQVALAVFVRFDVGNEYEGNIFSAPWIAVRQIRTGAREADGRKESLSWVSLAEWPAYLAGQLNQPGMQIFQPNEFYDNGNGSLDVENLWTAWEFKMAVLNMSLSNGECNCDPPCH